MCAAGITYTVAEFNTIITMLGCMCATVQLATGYYATILKKRIAYIKTNDICYRAHRAFGGFATVLYFLGLFAGTTGFIGAVFFGIPPFEIESPSFNFHVWPSFVIAVIIISKTYFSYFRKISLYKKGRAKWLGFATFIAWAYNWISSAFSYYIRTTLANPQHPPPTYLLPIELLWLQILIPFLIGFIISMFILRSAEKLDRKGKK